MAELGKVSAFITRDAITRDAITRDAITRDAVTRDAITRATDAGRDLLVFTHPHAGIQVPAGTMEAGETPQVAVLRETWEETGLRAVAIVAHLATIPQDFEPGFCMLTEPFTLQTPQGAVALTRGWPLCVIAAHGDQDQVCWQYFRDAAGTFHADRTSPGWIPRRLLTTSVTRHLFHLTTTAPTPERWSLDADGHTFSLYWTPLARSIGLIDSQARWLDRVYDRLTRP